MPFTPIPEGSMPSPDEVLAQLQRESGEPTEGFITPDDIEFAWRVFLSRLAHLEDGLSGTDQFTAIPHEGNLPTVGPSGALLLAKDTGQWFVSDGNNWQRVGADMSALPGNVQAALNRGDTLTAALQGLLGGQTILPYDPQQTYQPGEVATAGGHVWLAVQTSTGVTPSGSAPQWQQVSLPTMLDQIKQALAATGASGNMPPPDDPGDDGKVLTARHGAGVWETLTAATLPQLLGAQQVPAWDPSSGYTKFDVVQHQDKFWIAGNSDTQPGEEPGTDPKWFPLTLPDLFQRTKHWRVAGPDDPADNGKVLVAQDGDAHWVPAPSGGGSTVTILEPAGDNAVSPTSTGGDAPTNLPQSPSVGDIVVNTTAGTAWVWGPSTQGGHDWLAFQRPYVFAIMGDPNAVAPADGDSPVVLDSHGWITPCNTDHVSLWAGELLINVESGAMWVLDGDSWSWQPVGGVGGADDGLTIKMIHEDWALPGADTVPEGTVYVIRKTGQLVESVSRRASSDDYRWNGDLAYAADDSNIGTGEAYAVSGLAADGASGTLAVARRGGNFGVDTRDLLDGVGVGDVIYVEDDAGNRYGGAVTAVEDPGDQGSWPGFRTWTTDGSASTGTIPADAMVTVYVDGAAWEPLTQDWMAPAPTRAQGDVGAVLTATGPGQAAWKHAGDPLYSMLKWDFLDFDPQDPDDPNLPSKNDGYGYVGIDGKTLSAATVLRVSQFSRSGEPLDVAGELTPGTIVTISPVGTATYLGQCGTFKVSYRVTGAATSVTGTQYLMDVPVEPYSITYWDGDFAGRFSEQLVAQLCYDSVILHIEKGEEVPDPPLTQLKKGPSGYVFTSGSAYGPGEVWMQYHTANTPGNGDVALAWESPSRGKDPSIKRVIYVDDAQDANGKANYFRNHLTDGHWYKITNTLDATERQVVSILDSSTGTATTPHLVLGDQGWVEQAGGGSTPIVTLTDAEYQALPTKDPDTLYVVKG